MLGRAYKRRPKALSQRTSGALLSYTSCAERTCTGRMVGEKISWRLLSETVARKSSALPGIRALTVTWQANEIYGVRYLGIERRGSTVLGVGGWVRGRREGSHIWRDFSVINLQPTVSPATYYLTTEFNHLIFRRILVVLTFASPSFIQ